MNTNDGQTERLIHEKLAYRIVGGCFAVHNALGCGLLEKVYENALSHELVLSGMRVEQQKAFVVTYREKEVGVYYADMVVDGDVIVEVKAVDRIEDVHRANC